MSHKIHNAVLRRRWKEDTQLSATIWIQWLMAILCVSNERKYQATAVIKAASVPSVYQWRRVCPCYVMPYTMQWSYRSRRPSDWPVPIGRHMHASQPVYEGSVWRFFSQQRDSFWRDLASMITALIHCDWCHIGSNNGHGTWDVQCNIDLCLYHRCHRHLYYKVHIKAKRRISLCWWSLVNNMKFFYLPFSLV